MFRAIYKYISLCFAAVCMLMLASCQDELLYEPGLDSDEVVVSFTIMPEAASASRASRDDGDGEEGEGEDAIIKPRIGDGTKCDVLIYAVYDKNDSLLEQYSRGVDDELKAIFNHDPGQTIKKVDKFPYTVNLIFKKGTEYKIAFWAQNSTTSAFNTADLRKVEVLYSEIKPSTGTPDDISDDPGSTNTATTTPNNDELRDVFCRSVKITPGGDGKIQQNVYLYRPMAQINVGTSGYDYEVVTRNAVKKYRY